MGDAGLEREAVTPDSDATCETVGGAGGAESGATGAPKADLERLAADLAKLDPEQRRRLLDALERGGE